MVAFTTATVRRSLSPSPRTTSWPTTIRFRIRSKPPRHSRPSFTSRWRRWPASCTGGRGTWSWRTSSRSRPGRRSRRTPSLASRSSPTPSGRCPTATSPHPSSGSRTQPARAAAGLEYEYNKARGRHRRQGDDHAVAERRDPAPVTRHPTGGLESGHRPGAHPRLAAAVRVRAGAGQGDRDLGRHQRYRRRHGREDGTDPLHGEPRRHPSHGARCDACRDSAGPRRRGAHRAGERRQRGLEQPGRDAALRAGICLQAGDLLGGFAGRPHQPELRLHGARPDQPGRLVLPRCRAAPDRAAQRHADPGPVVQHRDRTDRSGRGGAAPVESGEGVGLRSVDRAQLPR